MNLRSSIILSFFRLLSLLIFLSSPIFSVSFATVSKLACGEVFETLLILSAVVFPIKRTVGSNVC